MKKTPSGVFSRSLNLLSMTSKLAAREIGDRVSAKIKDAAGDSKLAARIDQARIMVDHLAHLKGAAMKAGQLLSLDTSDFLPPEVIEILSRLQSQATPHETADIKSVLLKELGKTAYGQIRNFSEQPIAAASIGQVHKAQINGEEVAIKIQYPGVADSIDSDLSILKKVAQGFIAVSGKRMDLNDTFKEVREVLKNEVDYEKELKNLESYTAMIASIPGLVIPRAYPEYSTARVLTMSFEKGTSIKDWIQSNPPLAQREQIAKLVLDLFCLEFAATGLVQTDPNFGNYLVRENPSAPSGIELILLDFGATLHYSLEFRNGYAALLRDLGSDDADKIFDSAVKFGLLDPREDAAARVAFKDMIQVSLEPFDAHKQPFVFTDRDFEKRTRDANIAFSKTLVYSPPPRQLLFLHRKLGGVFNLVKRLGVKLDLRPYWALMTEDRAN